MESYFEAATEAGVQILDVLLSRTGLESPLDELDPVDDPGHLALDVGRLHGQLGGGLEAGLGLSEGRRSEETKPLERIRLATARGASSLLTTNLLVSLTTSLLQFACPAILVLMSGLQEVVVEISHFAVLEVKYIVNWLNDPIAKWFEVEEEFEKEVFADNLD